MHIGDMMWGWWHGGWWNWSMGIGMALFWVGVILGVVLLVKVVTSNAVQPSPGPRSEAPLDVLRRRYAAGEIDRAEYEQKSEDLRS